MRQIESPIIRSFRELLGVNHSASAEELKKAYKKMAALYHPDVNPDVSAHQVFLKIRAAYETLGNKAHVQDTNSRYLNDKLFKECIEGINICFGSFFGYRRTPLKRISKNLRIGFEVRGEEDRDLETYDLSHSNVSDTTDSILDNPAYDSIEVLYAGRLVDSDENLVLGEFKGATLAQLPWVALNNRGIYEFLNGKYTECLKTYDALNRRVPNNIIFVYRLGIIHTILAFKGSGKTAVRVPKKQHLKISVELLKRAIAIGQNRSVGKQKCLMIRKTLADIYEKSGERRLSRKLWTEIRKEEPHNREAERKSSLGIWSQLLKARD